MPSLPTFEVAPSAPDVLVLPRERMELPPGDYQNVIVQARGTLRLTGGIYEFRRLWVGANARVKCLSPCEIRVEQQVWLNSQARLLPGFGLNPTNVVLYIAKDGGYGLLALSESRISANVLAPHARLWLGANGRYKGAFIGKIVDVMPDARLWLNSAFGP